MVIRVGATHGNERFWFGRTEFALRPGGILISAPTHSLFVAQLDRAAAF